MNVTMAGQQEAGVIGFAAMVARGGREVTEVRSVARELVWQREVKGEQGCITLFMEQVLSLQEVRAFAFMKPGLPWIYTGHGFGKFFSLAGTVPDLEGKSLCSWGTGGSTGTQLRCFCLSRICDQAAMGGHFQTAPGMELWQPG